MLQGRKELRGAYPEAKRENKMSENNLPTDRAYLTCAVLFLAVAFLSFMASTWLSRPVYREYVSPLVPQLMSLVGILYSVFGVTLACVGIWLFIKPHVFSLEHPWKRQS